MADAVSPPPDNPTQRFIADAVAKGLRDTPLDINPAFASSGAVLKDVLGAEIVVGFTAGEHLTQGNGVVGGGALASMLDQSMAIAVLAKLRPGQTCSTIGLNINIMRSGAAGAFVARAGVDKIGGRVAFSHARLYDAEGALIASASSSLAVLAEQRASDPTRST